MAEKRTTDDSRRSLTPPRYSLGEEKSSHRAIGIAGKAISSFGTPDTAASTPEAAVASLGRHVIPLLYIDTIQTIFGTHVDLYRDVMHVSPSANERQIRIAYFKQGRKTLQGKDQSKPVIESLSKMTKRTFEAISMGYEILSTPSWKATYDKANGSLETIRQRYYGGAVGVATQHPRENSTKEITREVSSAASGDLLDMSLSVISSCSSTTFAARTSSPPRSVLRRTKSSNSEAPGSTGIESSPSRGKIRWNESVEEVIYKEHPEEADFKRFQPDEVDNAELLQDLLAAEEEQDRLDSLRRSSEAQNSGIQGRFISFFDNLDTKLDTLEETVGGIVNYFSDDEAKNVDRAILEAGITPMKKEQSIANGTHPRHSVDTSASSASTPVQSNSTGMSHGFEDDDDDGDETNEENDTAARNLFASLVRPPPASFRSSFHGSTKLAWDEPKTSATAATSSTPPNMGTAHAASPSTRRQRSSSYQTNSLSPSTERDTTISSSSKRRDTSRVALIEHLLVGLPDGKNEDPTLSPPRAAVVEQDPTTRCVPVGVVHATSSNMTVNSGITCELDKKSGCIKPGILNDMIVANTSKNNTKVQHSAGSGLQQHNDQQFYDCLSLYMASFSDEMEKLGTVVSQFGSEVGKHVSANWEQANQTVSSLAK